MPEVIGDIRALATTRQSAHLDFVVDIFIKVKDSGVDCGSAN
jgi:hypothetical protein